MPGRKASRSSKSKDKETFIVAIEAYANGMKAFQKRDWAEARDQFRKFTKEFGARADVSEIADRARMHLATCERLLAPDTEEPTSAEGWLLHGVILANEGRTNDALAAFDRAAQSGAAEGRVHYARAAALAVADRSDESLKSLARAIQADAENRAFSLGDPDFERLREMAGYVSLVEPPSGGVSIPEELTAYDPSIDAASRRE